MIACKCGCGNLITEFDKKGRKHFYVSGHNTKGSTLPPHTEEHKRHISEALRDNIPWNKGKKMDPSFYGPEWRAKQSKAHTGRILGAKSPHWKGDNVGYGSLHTYVRSHLKPPSDLCQICNIKRWCDLANVTGVYNRDFSNWQYMCRKCHMISDGRLDKTTKRKL